MPAHNYNNLEPPIPGQIRKYRIPNTQSLNPQNPDTSDPTLNPDPGISFPAPAPPNVTNTLFQPNPKPEPASSPHLGLP